MITAPGLHCKGFRVGEIASRPRAACHPDRRFPLASALYRKARTIGRCWPVPRGRPVPCRPLRCVSGLVPGTPCSACQTRPGPTREDRTAWSRPAGLEAGRSVRLPFSAVPGLEEPPAPIRSSSRSTSTSAGASIPNRMRPVFVDCSTVMRIDSPMRTVSPGLRVSTSMTGTPHDVARLYRRLRDA